MDNNENFVTEEFEEIEEVAENVEQTTEETQQVKTYTQEEVDAIVGKRLARKEARIRKEYDRKYGDLEGVLKAGMDKEDIGEITEDLRDFYGNKKGIKMPSKIDYSEADIEMLARAEADDIIRGGYEDAVEEVDRLTDIGYADMTAREKAVFKVLAEYVDKEERKKELSSIGVTEEVYESAEFKDFASKFNSNIPIKDVYEIYRKTQPKKNIKPMGSMKQGQDTGVKDYYTPEEIERLTEEDLDNPKVWEAVRRSMTGR